MSLVEAVAPPTEADARCRAAVEQVCNCRPDATALAPLSPVAPSGDANVSSPRRAQLKELRGALKPFIAEAADAVQEEAVALISDDWMMFRFLQAREYKIDEAAAMFRAACVWRVSRGVNRVVADLHPAAPTSVRHAAARQHFYAGYCGVSRDGGPVFCERLGRVDLGALARQPETFALMRDAYVAYIETFMRAVRLASARAERLVRGVVVVDAAGMSFSTLRHIGVIKTVAAIGPPNYPETTAKVFIVNVPFVFSAAWAMVSPLLPAHTRSKVHIFGADFAGALGELVAPGELPDFIGGTQTTFEPRAERIPADLGERLAADRKSVV